MALTPAFKHLRAAATSADQRAILDNFEKIKLLDSETLKQRITAGLQHLSTSFQKSAHPMSLLALENFYKEIAKTNAGFAAELVSTNKQIAEKRQTINAQYTEAKFQEEKRNLLSQLLTQAAVSNFVSEKLTASDNMNMAEKMCKLLEPMANSMGEGAKTRVNQAEYYDHRLWTYLWKMLFQVLVDMPLIMAGKEPIGSNSKPSNQAQMFLPGGPH